MISGGLLKVQPSELKFPFELKRQTSCSMQLTNKTDQYVAFKVKTTSPRKYSVRPNVGVVQPRSTCTVTVTMQAPKEPPSDLHSKDKFLIQSVIANDGATTKDVTSDMFNKDPDKVVEEFKLRVVFIPANPPSPVPEESEEGTSPQKSNTVDSTSRASSLFDEVSRSLDRETVQKPSRSLDRETVQKTTEAATMIAKLTEDRNNALTQNKRLQQELELQRKEISRHDRGYSAIFVVLLTILGIIIGFFFNKT